MAENKAIVVKNLCKSFDGRQVLENFSYEFKLGETTTVVGKSGNGKTTLLNILLGLTKADSGNVEGMPDRVGVVFQEDRLCEDFSVKTAIRMVMDKYALNRCGKERTDDYIDELLKRLDLKNFADKKVADLSGGEKRRVAIARMIAYFPEVYILDEAFKGLDNNTKIRVMNVLKEEMTGKTVIAVTHDKEEVSFWGGRIVEIGKI